MKNTRSIVMLVVAVLAGLAAVLIAARWIREQSRVSADRVAVAMMDVQLGSRITPEMIMMIDWPMGTMPSGAHKDPGKLAGRVVRTSLTRGEPILEGKLAPEGTQGGLSAVLSAGKRAITVRVNDVVGVAGYALPGNYVDIMVNTQEAQGSQRTNDKDLSISKIVLEQILVLAVGQEAGRDETKPRVVNAVTLEVTPEQAEKIDLARSVGNLSLVLRNPIDQTPSATRGVTKEILLASMETSAPVATPTASAPVVAPPAKPVARSPVRKPAAAPVAKAPARQGDCVEVIRGTSKSVECF
ncbi:Flp pilus assembly protein CpaB [Uliginosibacterium aquaticum]|uniref:Flp pilus assembly protein CpaB n=1 Tax=Uliginosibacterium aquaticum TaxID=2731212 RepID=A0ABX2IF03_9RHOO|nr:Flp pilus assembly protein CpaB [Uliginosibacterium aquaticum]NSL54727.1 Flp pilus assembly protein CpaB [Uliginosibacterium aquaticum]